LQKKLDVFCTARGLTWQQKRIGSNVVVTVFKRKSRRQADYYPSPRDDDDEDHDDES